MAQKICDNQLQSGVRITKREWRNYTYQFNIDWGIALLDRLSYKKVIEQCVVIPSITWLTSKFLVQFQIGYFISNQAKPYSLEVKSWSELMLD